jgi:hypothetical protein
MKKLLGFFLIFGLQANEVKHLKKGDTAPYEGYLFDLEAEQKVQFKLLQKERLDEQVVYLEQNIKLYKEDAEEWRNVATQNTERLLKLERNTFWQNALFFTLGVVATSALAIGLSKGLD